MDILEEFEHYSFNADKGQSPLRVDKFLMNFIEYATRNKVQQSIDAGKVRVNDKIVSLTIKLSLEIKLLLYLIILSGIMS